MKACSRRPGRPERLAADFPTRPEFRQDLARTHGNLGNLLRDTGRLKEAEDGLYHRDRPQQGTGRRTPHPARDSAGTWP